MTTKNPSCVGDQTRPDRPAAAIHPDATPRGTVKESRMGRRRAWTLVLIHVAVFLHLLHWKLSGRTLSPLEPSEAMYTLLDGTVNAGALLLLLSLASTLVIGRFFCGWTCHLVAVQDLSAWLLKKIGIHPRPLRSRWLMLVPLLSALYMFFWPSLMRAINSRPAPDFVLNADTVQKLEFWQTFPGFWVGLITYITAGFAMVYLLGAKGFCTYACPYGGLFGVIDRFSVGRILVTDACKGCGHCTAVCTSNVIVHEEVRDYGMVVDPGCMKCQDCVSVCPEHALHFGFGMPALFARKRTKIERRSRWNYSFVEEVALAAIFVATLLIFRGVANVEVPGTGKKWFVWTEELYGEVPLLWALGLAAVTAFVVVGLVRALRQPDARFQWFAVREAGRFTRAGRWFVLGASLWIVFLIHSSYVQYHLFMGNLLVEETAPIADATWRQDAAVLGNLSPALRTALVDAARHFDRADAAGLFEDVRIARQRAWLALINRDVPGAERILRDVATRHPDFDFAWSSLARVLAWNGRPGEARDTLLTGIRARPNSPRLHSELAELLTSSGAIADAITEQREAVRVQPSDQSARLQLATLLTLSGEGAEAVTLCEAILAAQPRNAGAHFRLAVALELTKGAPAIILEHLEKAAELVPNDRATILSLAEAAAQFGQPGRAEAAVRRLASLRPNDAEVIAALGDLCRALGRTAEADELRARAKALGFAASRPATESR